MTPEEAAEFERLKQETAALREELKAANNTIRRAKDPTPIKRPGFGRVFKLVSDACMSLERIKCGWILSLGKLERFFVRLREIWKLLIQEDWFLSDIFPPTPTTTEKPSRLKGGYCDLSRPKTPVSNRVYEQTLEASDRPKTPVSNDVHEQKIEESRIQISRPKPAPTPAPIPTPIRKTSHDADHHGPHHPDDIEVMRAQWRLFPRRRAVLESEAARLGIKIVPI